MLRSRRPKPRTSKKHRKENNQTKERKLPKQSIKEREQQIRMQEHVGQLIINSATKKTAETNGHADLQSLASLNLHDQCKSVDTIVWSSLWYRQSQPGLFLPTMATKCLVARGSKGGFEPIVVLRKVQVGSLNSSCAENLQAIKVDAHGHNGIDHNKSDLTLLLTIAISNGSSSHVLRENTQLHESRPLGKHGPFNLSAVSWPMLAAAAASFGPPFQRTAIRKP